MFFMVFLIFFLLVSLDPFKILSILVRINPDFLILILITNLLALLFFFLAWHILLQSISPISMKENFISTAISIFFNLTVPSFTLSGEIARVRYLNKKCNVPNEVLLATLSINKFQYGIIMSIFLTLGVILMYYYGFNINLIFYLFLIVILLNILLLMIILYPQIIKKIFKRFLYLLIHFKKIDNNKFKYYYKKSFEFVDNFSASIKIILRSSSHLLALLFISLQWFFSTLSFYVAFISLGIEVNLGVLLFTFPIMSFLTISSFIIPANIGLAEPLMILVYAGFGIDPASSFVAILLARGIIILEDLLITAPLTLKYGESIIKKPFE